MRRLRPHRKYADSAIRILPVTHTPCGYYGKLLGLDLSAAWWRPATVRGRSRIWARRTVRPEMSEAASILGASHGFPPVIVSGERVFGRCVWHFLGFSGMGAYTGSAYSPASTFRVFARIWAMRIASPRIHGGGRVFARMSALGGLPRNILSE